MSDPSHLNNILYELFRRVGQVFHPDFCQEPNWYSKYTWTKEEEDSFREWLVQYLHKGKINCSKRASRKHAEMIILNYGWVVKEKEDGILADNNS